MNNNRRLFIYGAVCVAVLAIAVSIFFVKLFSSPKSGETVEEEQNNAVLFRAVPSDAVLLMDVGKLGDLIDFVNDTASAIYGFIEGDDALHLLCREIAGTTAGEEAAVVMSLHYSSKNEVSFLCVAELPLWSNDKNFNELFPFLDGKKKRYNNTDIHSFKDETMIARYGNIFLMSNSLYVLESSIRHLDNEISILDNPEFNKLYQQYSTRKSLYVNHQQIGKFFSGVMERNFLKYSDFFMRLASWSAFPVTVSEGSLLLYGILENGRDEKYQSSVLYGQQQRKSDMGAILPAETIFAFSMVISDMQEFKRLHLRFLDVHKKLSGYKYKQHLVDIEGAITSDRYTDSLEIEEVVSAYCRFGERYEWLNFVKEKSSFGISDVVASVMSDSDEVEVLPYIYKGYLGSVLGEVFTHCNEESYCKMNGWTVIGPKDVVSEFASGSAVYFNMEQFMEQTPLSDFLREKGTVKMLLNMQEGRDSISGAVKRYYRNCLDRNISHGNFNFLTVNIGEREAKIAADVKFYATRLKKLPEPEPVDRVVESSFADSTIVVDKGPFELVDFVNGGKCYLEQAPDNKLRLLNGKRKGVWTIPFETPLCGAVAQVDFFKNDKLQMLFASENKLYLLDRLGRVVKGFPVVLPDKVVYGPVVIDPANDKNYSFMVLNEDNSVALYPLARYKIGSGIKIKAPEFVKEMPVLRVINGKNYLFLKTVNRIRIYNMLGKEILVKEKRRIISPQSDIVEVGGDEIRVKSADGKDFIINLANGKTRKE